MNDETGRALLEAQSGLASWWLCAVLSARGFEFTPLRLQTCIHALDLLGDRPAACAQSGKLKLRSSPPEKTWAGVLRDAGARVCNHFFLRTLR